MIDAEIKRLKQILNDSGVSDTRKQALEPVIENVAFMRIKLDDAREKIAESSVVIPYDNGGGQTGIRENPLYKGYESLWKSYMSGLDKILSALPVEIREEIETEKPRTMLELVRDKHKKEA